MTVLAAVAVALLLATTATAVDVDNDLTCQLCVDIVGDIDSWITSDKTEEEILDFFNQVRMRGGLGFTY